MKYTILQLRETRLTEYGFMDFEFAKTHNFSLADYEIRYEGELDDVEENDIDYLEKLFFIFNNDHPTDFKGHSLSMSDLVILEDEFGKETIYYCDRFGWEDINGNTKSI